MKEEMMNDSIDEAMEADDDESERSVALISKICNGTRMYTSTVYVWYLNDKTDNLLSKTWVTAVSNRVSAQSLPAVIS